MIMMMMERGRSEFFFFFFSYFPLDFQCSLTKASGGLNGFLNLCSEYNEEM
jgi:hypothetical protein